MWWIIFFGMVLAQSPIIVPNPEDCILPVKERAAIVAFHDTCTAFRTYVRAVSFTQTPIQENYTKLFDSFCYYVNYPSPGGVPIPNGGNLNEFVQCTGDSLSIISLEYHGNDAGGIVPAALDGLSNLQRMDFRGCNFSGPLPSIPSLTQLTFMDFDDNILDGELPDFVTLQALSTLNLQHNRLSGTLPAKLYLLTSLQNLRLAGNLFTGSIPSTYANFSDQMYAFWISDMKGLGGPLPNGPKNVQYYRIENNNHTGTIPTEIFASTRLSQLLLQSNRLSGTFPEQIQNLDGMTELNLATNLLTGTIPNLALSGKNWQSIKLHKNKFTGEIPDYQKFVDLRVLSLHTNQLSGTIPPFDNLGSLVQLYLSANNLTGTVPDMSNKFPLIEQLHLFGNRLHGSLNFSTQTNLLQLFLFDNKFTEAVGVPELTIELYIYEPQSLYCDETFLCPDVDDTLECINNECICKDGYTFSQTNSTCDDVDECYLGLWGSRISNNTNASCNSKDECMNTRGSFNCCRKGYRVARAGGATCEDINECLERTANCSAGVGACVNTDGGYLCCDPGFINRDQSKMGDLGLCEDINECLERTSNCSAGVSACVNTNGSYICCLDGFINLTPEIFGDQSICQDINECLPPRTNNCSAGACVNTNGSYICCLDGYTNPHPEILGDKSICQDVNECTTNDLAYLHKCNTLRDLTYCHNTIGNYTCLPCGEARETQRAEGRETLFRSLQNYRNHNFTFYNCWGQCDAGFLLYSYYSTPEAAPCSLVAINQSLFCYWACGNLTNRATALTAIDAIRTEFRRGDFIKDIFRKIFNADIEMTTSKRQTSTIFSVSPCTETRAAEMQQLIEGLSREVAPSVPALEVTFDFDETQGTCSGSISATDPVQSAPAEVPIVPIIIGVVVAAVVLVLLALAIAAYYHLYANDLKYLPKEVAWSYRQYKLNPLAWSFRGTSKTGYHYRELDKSSEHFSKASKLFSEFQNGKYQMQVQTITAVYNTVLIKNFVGCYRISMNRSQKKEFSTKRWEREPETNTAARKWVDETFANLCRKYPWNKDPGTTNIIPALHGTDLLIAEKICENGFASLSSLDSGFFGKGIYFTTHAPYALPYIVSRARPAIIISWVIPGLIYPVVEDHQGPDSLLGTAIQNGYNSHYVLVNKTGCCLKTEQNGASDELVVSQESQIAPAYIVEMNSDSLIKIAADWARVLPSQDISAKQPTIFSVQDDSSMDGIPLVILDQGKAPLPGERP